MSARPAIALAGLSGALAVALGAYGAHGLDGDAVLKGQFETANRYHMWHTLALLATGLWLGRLDGPGRRWVQAAAVLFAAGILLFSGALYAATVLDRWDLAFLAPWGGGAFMAGWLALAGGALRAGPRLRGEAPDGRAD